MPTVDLTLEGAAEAAATFGEMTDRARDLTPVFELAHDLWLEEIGQQFRTQGKFFLGSEWEPLNPEYAARKLRLYGPPPGTLGILYATGRMYEAFTDPGNQEHVAEIGPTAAVFGAQVEYAKYHQAGTERMPERRIISVRQRFKRTLLRAMLLFIRTGSLPEVGKEEE